MDDLPLDLRVLSAELKVLSKDTSRAFMLGYELKPLHPIFIDNLGA